MRLDWFPQFCRVDCRRLPATAELSKQKIPVWQVGGQPLGHIRWGKLDAQGSHMAFKIMSKARWAETRISSPFQRLSDNVDAELCALDKFRRPGHVGLIHLLDFFEDATHYYMAMPKLSPLMNTPSSVAHLLDGGANFDGVQLPGVEDMARQLLSAGKFLEEQGLSHQDISLNNMCQAQDKTLKLIDYGQMRYHKCPWELARGRPVQKLRQTEEGGVVLVDEVLPNVPFENCTRKRVVLGRVGKPGYTAPEAWHESPQAEVMAWVPDMQAGARHCLCCVQNSAGRGVLWLRVNVPDAIQGGRWCQCHIMGNALPPIDIFQSGMAILRYHLRAPSVRDPRLWQVPDFSDAVFAMAFFGGQQNFQPGGETLWGQGTIMQRLQLGDHRVLTLVEQMLNLDPDRRPSMGQCLGML